MAVRRRRIRGKLLFGGAVVTVVWIWMGGPGQLQPADTGVMPGPTADAAAGGSSAPQPGKEPVEDAAAKALLRELADSDRLEGALYGLRRLLDEQRLGSAFGELDRAAALDLAADSVRERRTSARSELKQRLRDGVEELITLVTAGRVVEARARLRRWRDPAHASVDAELEAAVTARGWPSWSEATPAQRPPRPAPLPRDRRVRVHHRDDWRSGRVVASTAQEVTVELRLATGVAFAFVGRADVEPESPSLRDAADQGMAGLHAGDVALAAMWLSHCLARDPAAADPAVGQLVTALGRAGQRASRPR